MGFEKLLYLVMAISSDERSYIEQRYLEGLGVWCLAPLSTILHLYRGIMFIGGGNRSTQKKPPTCRKSLTSFIT